MRLSAKRIFLAAAALVVLCVVCISGISANDTSADPADSYVKETAEYEDSTLSLWFEHSFKKVFTSDTTPSGMDTYSVYMAKNEIENAQFVLYSDTDKTGMKASVSAFTATDGSGATMSAEIYYEMYINVTNVNTQSILGTDDSSYLIRNGETPDPVAPLKRVKTFKLNGGKSQAFFIKIKSTADTPAGWYSARLNIMNSSGQVVKTATVYSYVWDFALSEKTELQTAMFMTDNTSYGGTYKAFYDYLLENRLCAMDVPDITYGSTADKWLASSYLTNDRVSAVRVSYSGCGVKAKGYQEADNTLYWRYTDIYNALSQSDMWDSIKDKLYFYTADEPLPVPDGHARHNADVVINNYNVLKNYWPDPRVVVAHGEESAYPQTKYTAPLTTYSTKDLYDVSQALMDTGSVTLWCPRIYAFTPKYEIDAYGKYAGIENGAGWSDQIRTMSGPYSGAWSNAYYQYFNWEAINGYYADRYNSFMAIENAKGKAYESWAYSAGWNKSYTYCNHLIENTGLQTKMLFWQLYQNDVTGYLYYGVNNWGEYDANNGSYVDNTVTGALTGLNWKTNKLPYANGFEIHGNGVLFYGASQAKIMGTSYIGSLRVEIMRDGIEEYQMLTMLEDLKGKDAAKAVVSKVSKNVVNYLSMPAFSTSAWSSDMDEYDIMASVRKELGNAVEAATLAGQCEHNWNSGTVVTAAGCITTGEKKFTCTICGAERTEIIPTLHSTGSTFTVVSGSAATCTTDSTEILRCSVCGYEKASTVKAFHSDSSHYIYQQYNETSHKIVCDTCSKQVDLQAHVMLTKYTNTCTEAGEKQSVCRFCGYTVVIEELEAKGHNYVDGVCTTCGAKEAGSVYTLTVDGVTAEYSAGDTVTLKAEFHTDGQYGYRFVYWSGDTDVITDTTAAEITFTMPEKDVTLTKNYVTVGDSNGDGRVNGTDTNYMKRTLTGSLTETSAMDINLDGRVNGTDANLLKRILVGSYVPEK